GEEHAVADGAQGEPQAREREPGEGGDEDHRDHGRHGDDRAVDEARDDASLLHNRGVVAEAVALEGVGDEAEEGQCPDDRERQRDEQGGASEDLHRSSPFRATRSWMIVSARATRKMTVPSAAARPCWYSSKPVRNSSVV